MKRFIARQAHALGKVPCTPSPTAATRTAARHAFKGLQDWIEVFRAGAHVDSKGRECAFTEADLDQMAANVALHAPPAVLGHPKDHDPAYAWAKEARRDGDGLFVKFSDINPAFEAGVDSGAYRNRSVSIFKDAAHGWRLNHIGWLGAAPPAIAGLAPLQYTAPADAEAHEFAVWADADNGHLPLAWALGDVATLMRGLRDWLIGKDGLDVANTVLPDWTLTSLANAATALRDAASAAPAFTQPDPTTTGNPTMNFTQADIDRAAAEARTATEAQFAQQQQELVRLQGERQTERIGALIGGWRAKGLVLPAEEPGLAEFMAALESGTSAEFTFTRATESLKKTPAQWFAEFVASRKPLVKLGARLVEVGDPEPVDTSDYRAIVSAAREFQHAQLQKGITVSDEAAVQHIKDTHGARS